MHPGPIVLVTEHLDETSRAWLAARARVIAEPPSVDDALRDAEGLVVRTYTRVDGSLLDRAPNLRVVGRAGVGLDNIDVAACRARGVEVVHTPSANTQAVVEFVLLLLMQACGPPERLVHGCDAATWRSLRAAAPERRQVSDMVVGILGLGRIGRGVARALAALGARVLYHDLVEIPEPARFGAEPVGPQQLFRDSNALTVHVDDRPGNRGLVGRALLSDLREDAILLNTSRGFVVDNSALAEFLLAHPHAQALLDVHEPEPVPDDAPLLAVPNATLYPHVAARTATAQRNMGRVVEDVVAVLEGRAPRWPAPVR